MNLQPAQGLDAAGTFAKMVSSDDSKIYVTGFDGKQHLLGHGVRFSIAPNTWWNSAFCDERSWRITVVPNVSGRTPSNTLTQPVILFQTNSFSSGTCRQVPGTITTTRVRQQVNLFTGDAPSAFTPADPYFNSPLTVPSVDKPGLMALPPDSSSLNGSFAGRGLYGDYILVFPTCDASNQCGSDSGYTAANLAKLTDVAIRIDFVAATNVPNNPN
jgi:hypothetical protein